MKQELSRKQHALILALLSNPSVDQACKACGVGRSSFYRYLQDPVFRREWADAKAAGFSEAIAILSRAASTCANVLTEIATDKSAPVTGRVSAARAILEWATRGVDSESTAADARVLADELRRRKATKS
jgi:hypothetical protein